MASLMHAHHMHQADLLRAAEASHRDVIQDGQEFSPIGSMLLYIHSSSSRITVLRTGTAVLRSMYICT